VFAFSAIFSVNAEYVSDVCVCECVTSVDCTKDRSVTWEAVFPVNFVMLLQV
jgi:hypothetical protein